MAKIIFILGGVRSGKSALALEKAGRSKKAAYLATGIACDKEMKKRISHHKETRPVKWDTIEEQIDLDIAVKSELKGYDAVVLDCLGCWITNLMIKFKKKKDVEKAVIEKVRCFLDALKKYNKLKLIAVSNEVGMGIVPPTKMGRECRDILGRVNQLFAKEAKEVHLTVAGIACRIK